MQEGLQIPVGVDLQNSIANIGKLNTSFSSLSNSTSANLGKIESSLVGFSASAQRSFSILQGQLDRLKRIQVGDLGTNQLTRVNALIAKTEAQIKKLSASFKPIGFDDFTQKSNAATQALTNLGRVAQDAPFGFIGIANNLNPLLESFQRLKAETGSGKAALSALAGSLTGAGGLGLALSAVTAAASFASIGMQAWGGKLFGASKEAEALAKKADELKSAIDGAFSSTAQEATRVTALTAILQNETETRKRRLAAIKELQDIQPEIFAGLKLEGDTVVGLDSAYKKYIDTLQTVVAAKIKQAQLEVKITELLQLQGATLTSSEKKIRDMGKAFRESFNQGARGTAIGAELERIDKFGKQGTGGIASFLNGISDAAVKGTETTRIAIDRLKEDIDGLTKDLIELSPGIDVKLPDAKKVKEAVTLFMSRAIGDLRKAQDLIPLTILPLPLEFQFLVDDSKNSLKFSNVKKELEGRLQQFALKQSSVPLLLQQQIEIDPNLKIPAGLRQEMEKEFLSQFASGTPLFFDIDAEGRLKVRIDTKSLKQQLQTDVSNAIQTSLQGIDTFIGESIGNAISGIGSAQDIFKGVFNFIAEGVKQIGIALIKMGLLFEGIQTALASLATRPELALALGIAAVALSQVIKNSFTGAREKGGPVSQGLKYLVNEKGREIFVPNNPNASPAWIEGGMRSFTPPSSGRIIPAWQAKAFAAKFNIPKFETGGLVSGPTFGLLGEGIGINALNPEVVAPLQTLKSLIGSNGPALEVRVTGSISGDVIKLNQSRTDRAQRRKK